MCQLEVLNKSVNLQNNIHMKMQKIWKMLSSPEAQSKVGCEVQDAIQFQKEMEFEEQWQVTKKQVKRPNTIPVRQPVAEVEATKEPNILKEKEVKQNLSSSTQQQDHGLQS